MKKLMTVVVSALCAAMGVQAKTTDVTPADDLVAIAAAAESGDVIQLAAGTHELEQQIALVGKSNITFIGAGKDKTFIVVKDGVSSRHVSLSGMTNVKFEGISFRNAKLEYDAADATSTQGGSFRVENTENLQIEGCEFVSNQVQNTTVAGAAVNLYGGVLCALDSDVHFLDSDFKENGILWTEGNSGNKECYGGVVYMNTPTGASDSVLRLNLTATNCVFRGNFINVNASGTEPLSYGGVLAATSVGADFYNCLMTGTRSTSYRMLRNLLWTPKSTGSYTHFTQCTIADNVVANAIGSSAWNSIQYPVFERSVLTGHWRDIDETGEDPNVVLIDSVYSAGLEPVSSVTRCGKTFKSGNYFKVDADTVLEHEGQVVAGGKAAELNAGWRPVVAKTYRDWYVAADASASDENDGTAASPFRTLKKAVSVVGDGETIHLAAGTYAQSSGEVYPYDLTGKYGVTIAGAGRGLTVLDGEDDTSEKTAFVFDNTHSFKMKDLTVTRFNPKSQAAGTPVFFSMVGCAHPIFSKVDVCNNKLVPGKNVAISGMMTISFSAQVTFLDCLLTNNCHRSHAYNSGDTGWMWNANWSYLTLRRCEVRHNGWIPYSAAKPGNHTTTLVYLTGNNASRCAALTAEDCLFADNGCQGEIKAGSMSSGYFHVESPDVTRFENCTFVGNDDGVLAYFRHVTSLGTSGFYNCIISHPSEKAILDMPALTAWNKSYINAKNTLVSSTAEQDATLINLYNYAKLAEDGSVLGADAKFKDAANGDYHLTKESALAIDKGATLDWMSDASVDLDGNPRLVGYLKKSQKIPDIGCYELPRKLKGLMLILR